jgi:tousled-like kinase
MLYGRRPFGHGVSQDKLIHSREILKGNQIDFPNNSPKNYRISNEAKEFIRKCLERNP